MDGDAFDIQLLLAAARREIRVLEKDPRSGPLEGNRGAALRRHLLDLLGAAEHRLSNEPPANAPEPVRQAFARSLRQSIIVLQGAHAALPWLAATRTPTVNLGSLYLTEEFAQALVGPEVDLVVVPDPEFMYSTTSWPFAPIINATAGFSPATSRRPIVLNYPLSDSDRLLLHPIFAHELGHAAADQHGLVAAVEAVLDADADFVRDMGTAVAASSRYWPAASDAQRAGTLRSYLRSWIEELLCDHLALEATGPAFLWAFGGFGMPLSYGDPAPTHPPNTVRLKLAHDHLARRGWNAFMHRSAPRITSWLATVGAAASAPLDEPFSFFRDQLLRHAGAVQDVAIDRVGADALDHDVVEAQADEAAELLSRVILPVGLADPLHSRSILLGGWKHGIHLHGDSPAGLVKSLDDPGLQELVGKAIEMSTVSTIWRAK